jgi:hypothetical protein
MACCFGVLLTRPCLAPLLQSVEMVLEELIWLLGVGVAMQASGRMRFHALANFQ